MDFDVMLSTLCPIAVLFAFEKSFAARPGGSEFEGDPTCAKLYGRRAAEVYEQHGVSAVYG